MIETDLQELSDQLRQAIDAEREWLAPVLIALGEGQQQDRRDIDDLARKLAQVTEALVAADGALAQRVKRIEAELAIPGASRRSWLRRMFTRTTE